MILIWASRRPLDPALRRMVKDVAVGVVPCAPSHLETTIRDAVRSSAVCVVADMEKDVERALKFGAHEAITLADIDSKAMGGILTRAALRYETTRRLAEEVSKSLVAPDAAMFDLFSAELARAVTRPLKEASEELQMFRQALSTSGTARDGGRGVRSMPARRRAKPREAHSKLGAVAGSDPGSLVDHPLGLIQRVLKSIQKVEDLVLESPMDRIDARDVVLRVAAFMKPAIEPIAEFSVDVIQRPAWVLVPQRHLVRIVTTSLQAAILNAARKGGDRFVEIQLRICDHRVVIEIRDDGDTSMVASNGGTGRDWLPPFAVSRSREEASAAIALSTAHLRQNGGDLVVHIEPGEGTTVQVFLPKAEPARSPP